MKHQASYISCGVLQVYDLEAMSRSPLLDLLHMLGAELVPTVAHIVFSDANCLGNGFRLAREITDRFPRTLVGRSGVNPNTGNRIHTWIWDPDWPEVATWADTLTRPAVKEGAAPRREFTHAEIKKLGWNFSDEVELGEENEGTDWGSDSWGDDDE